MATMIRMARGGAKKRPYYRIVVADSRSPRDGKFIEKIGTYNPLVAQDRVNLKKDRVEYWLSQGATPSERVALFIQQAGIGKDNTAMKAILKRRDKSIKARQEAIRRKAEEAAKAAAAEAAAEAAKNAPAAEAAPAEEAPAA